MYEKLEAVNHDEPPYATRYLQLATILDNEPHKPLGNRVVSNIALGVDQWVQYAGSAKKQWLHTEDNVYRRDTSLPLDRPRQVVEQLPAQWLEAADFEPIPIDKIGLKRDAYRQTLPSR
jgi:hypothetical protein